MSLRINTNVDAFNSHRILSFNSDKMAKSMEKLSSGFRINRAADDAAGLMISERMRGQIGGLAQAQRNAQDGISLANTAEGGLQEITSMLQRVRELAIQHQNGTNDATTRTAIDTEARALGDEITRTIAGTTFNNVGLLNGGAAINLQVGANGTAADTLTVTPVNATTVMTTLNINTMFNGTGTSTPNVANIDTAINAISGLRGQMGAISNRLEYTSNALGIAQENMMAAESRIRDVDMAQEMTTFARLQILQESGVAMLAQANQRSANIVKLLQ